MVGRVWSAYIVLGNVSHPGLLPSDLAVPTFISCVFSPAGVPSCATQRTSLWVGGLRRIIETVEGSINFCVTDAESGWATRNMQFDLDANRVGGGICGEDRSYELAALVAALAAAFNVALPTGTVALGLVGPDIDPISRSPLIASLGREALALKLRGLVRSLPTLRQVFVPRCDAEYVMALLGERSVTIVDVRSVFDVIVALNLDADRFLGQRRQGRLMRIARRVREHFDAKPDAGLVRIMVRNRNSARSLLGSAFGAACGLITVGMATLLVGALQSNAPRAWSNFPYLPIVATLPIMHEVISHMSGKGKSARSFHLTARLLTLACCVELAFAWRIVLSGDHLGLALIGLGSGVWLVYSVAVSYVSVFARDGLLFALAYIRAFLAIVFLFGLAGISQPSSLWVIQVALIAYGAVLCALLFRIPWRLHSSQLLRNAGLPMGVTGRFLWLALGVVPLVMLWEMLHTRGHFALTHGQFGQGALPRVVIAWLQLDPRLPFGGERWQFPLLGLFTFLCSYALSKTVCVFFGDSLCSDEERRAKESAELGGVKPIVDSADELHLESVAASGPAAEASSPASPPGADAIGRPAERRPRKKRR